MTSANESVEIVLDSFPSTTGISICSEAEAKLLAAYPCLIFISSADGKGQLEKEMMNQIDGNSINQIFMKMKNWFQGNF